MLKKIAIQLYDKQFEYSNFNTHEYLYSIDMNEIDNIIQGQ